MFSFCGLNKVCIDREFKDYNVFFADNGVGKTSVTRAFELLIKQNSQHIGRYKTIYSQDDPQISFLTDSGAIITIDPESSATNLPFKIEIYNSDFLIQNVPLGSDFALKKLDDETIALSDSYLGKETKEEKELEQEKNKLQKRKDEINGSQANQDIKDEITKTQEAIKNAYDEIEKIRKDTSTKEIRIVLDEITIEPNQLNGKNNFNIYEKKLQEVQAKFAELNNSFKSFGDLPNIKFPNFRIINDKEKLINLFEFNIEKEAGKISENIKNHIIKVGREFIENGRKIIDTNEFDICPFCMQSIENAILKEYASYFNDAVENFNNKTQLIVSALNGDLAILHNLRNGMISDLEKFKPFLQNFEQIKINFIENIKLIYDKLEQIIKLVQDKKEIENSDKFKNTIGLFEKALQKCNETVDATLDILNNKKAQQDELNRIKNELKNLKIQKAKRDSFDVQKRKQKALELLNSLKNELNKIDSNIEAIDAKLEKLKATKKPDIKVINNYLIALNLTKYSVNSDYQLIINQKIISNDDVRMVLSDGEKLRLHLRIF